jgi:hypothetical protein
MKLPPIKATIDRRLLISYRVKPERLEKMLPKNLRLHLINGEAIAGVCLIRLKHVRPAFIGPHIGFGAENAAHRVAVEWETPEGVQTGVFIPERHSSSLVPVLLGGRILPGKHSLAQFQVNETDTDFDVELTSKDNHVHVQTHLSNEWDSSLFENWEQASNFYKNSPTGWSPKVNRVGEEGMSLTADNWSVKPAKTTLLKSSFYDAIPSSDITYDHTLVMQKISSHWVGA